MDEKFVDPAHDNGAPGASGQPNKPLVTEKGNENVEGQRPEDTGRDNPQAG